MINSNLIKKIIYSLIRKIPAGCPGKTKLGRAVLDCFGFLNQSIQLQDKWGNYFFIPNLNDSIGFELFIHGTYEVKQTQLILDTLKPSDIFIDVGANIGSYTIPMAQKLTPGKVLAFEASSRISSILNSNIQLNKFKNVTVINKALCEYEGKIKFYEADEKKYGMNSLGNYLHSPPQEIDCTTLDQALKEQGVSGHIAWLKADVEGAEARVFQGAKNTLTGKNPPRILFEFCDWAEKATMGRTGCAQEILNEYGFKIYRFKDFLNGLRPLNEILYVGSEMLVAVKE